MNLTKEQKELLNKLDESFSKSKSKHRPNEKSWLDGIKEFFDKWKIVKYTSYGFVLMILREKTVNWFFLNM